MLGKEVLDLIALVARRHHEAHAKRLHARKHALESLDVVAQVVTQKGAVLVHSHQLQSLLHPHVPS
jgi:hypothetical protein